MSGRWSLIAALLCPACASGSGPLPLDDGDTTARPVTTDDPPAAPAPAPAASATPAPAHPAAGIPASPAPASTSPPSGAPPSGAPPVDCAALWAVIDNVSCTFVRFVCAVLEAIPSDGAQVPCDIAVPIACGLDSAAATAALAACPH